MTSETISIRLHAATLTPAVVSVLKRHYQELACEADFEHNTLLFKTDALSAKHRRDLMVDMMFFDRNPTLPLENICSRMDNYLPQNHSQEELLKYAQRLIALDDKAVGAGLYMFGEAGIGKSHISVAISKQFMQDGLEPNFQFADRYSFKTELNLQPGQVWVIDDMNSGFGIASRLFKQVVLNAHEHGGRVFVTSNKEYDVLMKELFVGDGNANKMRYEDRTKGMFKILHVVGDSYRQANAWHQGD